ncbi:acyltransferase [Enterococcus sp. DIV0187]|jgi:maltose O-acetyltransferase|uniref:acyltransferase n=1 Tax=Enterococcus sp. DIV0187 TaxID=2774644 RepID=UPI003F297715
MKFIAYLFFNLLNRFFVPYRLASLEKKIRQFKNFFLKKNMGFVGKNANVRPYVKLSYLENISIGMNSSIGDRSWIIAADKVIIGNDVLMGPEVMIFTQNHEITNTNTKLINGGTIKKPVLIEDDCWIGARVIILPGAHIKSGTVIAAGSVVPGKEFPRNVVIGGNPAKVIKER